ncbi:restriction endonuclease subunit S [Prevotella melaninogenica]|uniref:restriction endonuclease subunit S n=1 Tax=Prevotella melaninogenica TaxID=28132 RepID=UPI003C75E6D4
MEYVKFKDVIINSQYGYTATETSQTEGTYKYLRITDIVPYYVNFDTVPFCKITEKDVSKYIVKEGDILIARTGATTGYNYVVPSGISNTVYASYLIRFIVDKKLVLPLFMKYVLKTQSYYGFINNYIGGSAQPGMNAKVFTKFNIPKLSLVTQQKIASILSSYDRLIENNTRRIRLLEQMAENLYKEWFVRFRFPEHENVEMVNGLPKGWKVKRISNVCKTIGGGTPSTTNSAYWGGDIKWVTPSDITSKKSLALLKIAGRITEEGLKKSSAKLLPPYTILMTSRASIGFFGICPDNVCTNQGFISIIPNKDNVRMYLLYTFKARKEEIISNANGSTFLEISKGRFRKMKLLVPSEDILNMFEKRTMLNFREVLHLEMQNQLLTRQRDLLLPRLMSGKLEVKP